MDGVSLTDRYVDAALRSIPEKQRADIGAELRASIEDEIDARVVQGEPHGTAERTVLTELGDPDRLSAKYTDRPLQLIGPRYYLDWWRLLKLLLFIVPPLAAFGVALGQVLAGATFGQIVGTVVVTVLAVVVHLGFWTTLVFAIAERFPQAAPPPVAAMSVTAPGLRRVTAPALFGTWTPDQLPDPRPAGAGLSELVASLVFLALAAGAILWDQFLGFVPGFAGLSFLAPDLWPWWIAGLFVLMALEALLAVAVYASRRWTTSLAWVNLALNLAVALPALWLVVQGRLLNPRFFPTVAGDGGADVTLIVTTVAGFGIAVIAAWDSVDAFLKARRSR